MTPHGDQATEGDRTARRGGMPGDGAGRREEPGRTGVHPFGTDGAGEGVDVRTGAEWGQGTSGPAGYEDGGTSEISGAEPGPTGGGAGRSNLSVDEAGPADRPTGPA